MKNKPSDVTHYNDIGEIDRILITDTPYQIRSISFIHKTSVVKRKVSQTIRDGHTLH